MNHFSIAGLQLSLPKGNSLSYIEKAVANTRKKYPWVDMIVLSELCSFGPETKYAEPLPGVTENFYRHLAKEHGIWLIPGSLFEKQDDKIFNTTSVINPEGEVVDRYRKIYPFYPYEKGVTSGDRFVVFDVPGGRIGLAICYDLWFPEVSRELSCRGAEVILYPTLTGTIDRPQELVLAQATAIQQQSYVFSINASGDYGNGQSIVVDPEGKVLYQAKNDEEIMPLEIDFSHVRRVRERGTCHLGQTLKSFRDNPMNSKRKCLDNAYLDGLGILEIQGTSEG